MPGPAALVVARAPLAGEGERALEALLGAAGCAALQALLLRRAIAWAERVAPGAAFVALDGAGAAVGTLPSGVQMIVAAGDSPAERLAGAVAQVGRGPLLVAGTDCPRLSSTHADAALGDLAAGCDVVYGSTLEGDWYLAGLREPRAGLLGVAPAAANRAGGLGALLERARDAGAEVGLLRHERVLLTPADAAAFLADPLLPADVRAALTTRA